MRHHSRVHLSVAVALAAGMIAIPPAAIAAAKAAVPEPIADRPLPVQAPLTRAERRAKERRDAKAAKKGRR